MNIKNLAPNLTRQRLPIKAAYDRDVNEENVRNREPSENTLNKQAKNRDFEGQLVVAEDLMEFEI